MSIVLPNVLLFLLQLESLWVGRPFDGAAVWCTETERDTPEAGVSTRRLENVCVYIHVF